LKQRSKIGREGAYQLVGTSRCDVRTAQRAVPTESQLKRLVGAAFCLAISLLLGCESINYTPPPVTSQMSKTGHLDIAQLRQGRTLFVSRCIECHALPSVAAHTAAEWPRLIDEMADRANLKPAEREALVAYIIAARTDSPPAD
jgi:hypothetical protein